MTITPDDELELADTDTPKPSEWVAWAGLFASAPQVAYPFLTSFGIWEPTVAQWSAVSALWAFLGAILTLLARGHVYAPETVGRLLDAARLRARQEASAATALPQPAEEPWTGVVANPT